MEWIAGWNICWHPNVGLMRIQEGTQNRKKSVQSCNFWRTTTLLKCFNLKKNVFIFQGRKGMVDMPIIVTVKRIWVYQLRKCQLFRKIDEHTLKKKRAQLLSFFKPNTWELKLDFKMLPQQQPAATYYFHCEISWCKCNWIESLELSTHLEVFWESLQWESRR